MPRRPENPDRRITPRNVADGLRRSGKDPAEIQQWLRKMREAVADAPPASDHPDGRPADVSAAEWEQYLATRDDERRRNEGYEAENPPSA